MDEDREIEGARVPLNFFELRSGDQACIRHLRIDWMQGSKEKERHVPLLTFKRGTGMLMPFINLQEIHVQYHYVLKLIFSRDSFSPWT